MPHPKQVAERIYEVEITIAILGVRAPTAAHKLAVACHALESTYPIARRTGFENHVLKLLEIRAETPAPLELVFETTKASYWAIRKKVAMIFHLSSTNDLKSQLSPHICRSGDRAINFQIVSLEV